METDAPLTDREAFQQRLELCIKRTGSLSRMIKLTGFPRYKLESFQIGRHQPTREELNQIARCAKVRAGWLAAGEDPMVPRPDIDELKEDEVYLRVSQQREVPGGAMVRSMVVNKRLLDNRAPEKAVKLFQAFETVEGHIASSDLLMVEMVDKVEISGIYLLEALPMPILRAIIVDPILGKMTMMSPTGDTEIGADDQARLRVVGRVLEVMRRTLIGGITSKRGS